MKKGGGKITAKKRPEEDGGKMRKREDKLNRVGKSFTGEDKLEIKL